MKLNRQLEEHKHALLPPGSPPPFEEFAARLQESVKGMDIQAEHDREARKRRTFRWRGAVAASMAIILLVAAIPPARAFMAYAFQEIARLVSGLWEHEETYMPRLTHEEAHLIHSQTVKEETVWQTYEWRGYTVTVMMEPMNGIQQAGSTDEYRTGTYPVPALGAEAYYYIDMDGIEAVILYGDTLMITISGPDVTDETGFLDVVASLSLEVSEDK